MNETYDPMASKTGLKPRMSTDLDEKRFQMKTSVISTHPLKHPTSKGQDSTINTINKIYFILVLKLFKFMTDSRENDSIVYTN